MQAHLRDLFDHHYWARDVQLRACSALAPELFVRPLESSFGSVRDTLAHMLGAEWVWLERLTGRSPAAFPDFKLPAPAAFEEPWATVERGFRSLLAGDGLDLGRTVSYLNFKGEPWTYPAGEVMLHLVTHQAYHRGQVTMLLRQLGARPPAVDFLVWRDTRAAPAV